MNKKALDSFVIFKAKVIIDCGYFLFDEQSWKGICPWCIKETKFITVWWTAGVPKIQCNNCRGFVTIRPTDDTRINVMVEKCE
mgnify:CR=1 FL=1